MSSFDDILRHTAELPVFEDLGRAWRGRSVVMATDAASLGHLVRAAAVAKNVTVVDVQSGGGAALRQTGTVVAASLVDEGKVARALATRLGREPIRLWADLFVRRSASVYGKRWPSAKDLTAPVPALPAVRSAYAIVCTPRSGSTMLAQMLAKLGVAGKPREHLRQSLLTLAEHTDFDLRRWTHAALAADTTPNGVFGTKLISHLLMSARRLWSEDRFDLTGFDRSTLRVVRLKRRNLLAQALSTYVAQESKVFFERNRRKKNLRNEFLASYEYDFAPLADKYTKLLADEERVDRLMARLDLPVLPLAYEDVLASPERALGDVLDFVEVPLPRRFSAPKPKMKKLDDSLTRPIYERFRADFEAMHGPQPF